MTHCIYVRVSSIVNASDILFSVFLQSQIASHTAAGALLFNQLLVIGCPCEVQPELMIASAMSVLTDLSHIQAQCPFNYGILDGLLMLLNQMLTQGDQMIADQYLESQLWDLMWTSVVQSLKPSNAAATAATTTTTATVVSPRLGEKSSLIVNNNNDEDALTLSLLDPDWMLVSPNGYMFLLQLALRMTTMSAQNYATLVARSDNVMFDALSYFLSDKFLNSFTTAYASIFSLYSNRCCLLFRI